MRRSYGRAPGHGALAGYCVNHIPHYRLRVSGLQCGDTCLAGPWEAHGSRRELFCVREPGWAGPTWGGRAGIDQ